MDKPNLQLKYEFNITGESFRLEMSLYKNTVSTENLIAYTSKVDESEYDPIVYPTGYRYNGWVYKSKDDLAFIPSNKYVMILKA